MMNSLQRISVSAFLFGAAFVALTISAVSFFPQASGFVAESDIVRLGDCSAGSDHDVQFDLYNRGWQSITVVDVYPECSCTVPALQLLSKSCAPGQRIPLYVKWHAPDVPGRAHNKIGVDYRIGSDKQIHQLVLAIVGEVADEATSLSITQIGG